MADRLTVSKSIEVNLNNLRKNGGTRIVLRLCCDIWAEDVWLGRGPGGFLSEFRVNEEGHPQEDSKDPNKDRERTFES